MPPNVGICKHFQPPITERDYHIVKLKSFASMNTHYLYTINIISLNLVRMNVFVPIPQETKYICRHITNVGRQTVEKTTHIGAVSRKSVDAED